MHAFQWQDAYAIPFSSTEMLQGLCIFLYLYTTMFHMSGNIPLILFGGSKICLHSQKRAKEFYQKQGYQTFVKEDYDKCFPHIWMYKEIK